MSRRTRLMLKGLVRPSSPPAPKYEVISPLNPPTLSPLPLE